MASPRVLYVVKLCKHPPNPPEGGAGITPVLETLWSLPSISKEPLSLLRPMESQSTSLTFYTIGHSNVPIETLLSLLEDNDITLLADVRSYPGSRTNPQFGKVALREAVQAAGIEYVHIPELGGRRTPLKVSPNGGWTNKSFQAYADHLPTEEFREGLKSLIAMASKGGSGGSGGSRVAYMCSEAVPWRCHRSLLSDVLVAKGFEVRHIMGAKCNPHVLGKWGAKPMITPKGDLLYPKGLKDLEPSQRTLDPFVVHRKAQSSASDPLSVPAP